MLACSIVDAVFLDAASAYMAIEWSQAQKYLLLFRSLKDVRRDVMTRNWIVGRGTNGLAV